MSEYLPQGYRFSPTEEELVCFYLRNKLQGSRLHEIHTVIPVLNIYDYNPSDLPQLAGQYSREDPAAEQWFFFIPRQDREARGGRPTRLTTEGYWKATGSAGWVYSVNNRVVGEKRTMVFYRGRAPTGKKTEWKMNEYRAIEGEASPSIHNNNIANLKCQIAFQRDTPVAFWGHYPLEGRNALFGTAYECESATTCSRTCYQLHQEFSVCRIYKRTKCVRAFDRRPIGPATAAVVFQPPAQAAGNSEASTSRPTAAADDIQRSCSSSGGDHDDSSFNLPPLWDELYCIIGNAQNHRVD